MVNTVFGLVFLVSSWRLVHMGSTSLAGLPVVYKTWVTQVASCWSRPLGGGWWGHYLCNFWEECLAAHKTACQCFGFHWELMDVEPYVLASAGQPSLHGYDACMVYWTKGALRRNCR